jgi:hypothetical protein
MSLHILTCLKIGNISLLLVLDNRWESCYTVFGRNNFVIYL